VCETSAVGGTTIRTRAPVVDRQRDGAGALLRRGLAVLSANSFLQIFAASLLAGLVGAVAVRLQLSSTLRLAALGLLLVLVPGRPSSTASSISPCFAYRSAPRGSTRR